MLYDADIQAMLDERARTMLEFTSDHRPMKIYAIYLRSLEMDPHKLGSQLGHAYEGSLSNAKKIDPTIEERYKGTGHGTKVVGYVKTLNQLLRGYREVQEAGVPHILVIDRGSVMLPHFTGAPIITALGIGPVYEDEVQEITKRFTMAAPKPK